MKRKLVSNLKRRFFSMHIHKISLHRFKQFNGKTIKFENGLSLITGSNNSGKSSILQALGTWQFCKTLVEIEKGRKGWLGTSTKSGVGLGIVDFTPLQIPSLKHLWTNLKTGKINEPDGYTLKISVFWKNGVGDEKFLEFGLSLANDRLFVKPTSTNLVSADLFDENDAELDKSVPNIAYLPPFAGITDREGLLTPAMRERMVGQGLSGGVIRNVLFDLHQDNRKKRESMMDENRRISRPNLRSLRQTDPWELLTRSIQETFGTDLKFKPFNERYHSYLSLETVKGELKGNAFKKYPGYNSRDLMVEGSGFLQCLSVLALSLSEDLDLILLDEPDAHLNASLQKELVDNLILYSGIQRKQILLATHSPELIRTLDYERIMYVGKSSAKYLKSDIGKIAALAGIGTTHTPKLNKLIECKKILIVEGESDERFLKGFAKAMGVEWPKELVTWFWTGKAAERARLFEQLRFEIPGLCGISIRDRDDEPDGTVNNLLEDKSYTAVVDGLMIRKWRRRHIENYLLSKAAIARAAGVDIDLVSRFFNEKHGLNIPDDPTPTDIFMPIRDARGKEIFTEGESIKQEFSISRDQVIEAMTEPDVPYDIKTLIAEICNL